ncbi:unnamed protein product [Mytilus coruscus]|uniref:Uncharacterized protein n=1 Tax=Mytilus coruscus TaxID=42192 RepID=A0A6J7ZTP5_MYTCO|nr:unnamed protein product [Mytilus coruscus]
MLRRKPLEPKYYLLKRKLRLKKEHARLKEEEAKSARKRSDLEADLTLLEHKKEAAAAEAELEALASSAGSSQRSRKSCISECRGTNSTICCRSKVNTRNTKLNVQEELTTNVNETKKDQDEVPALSVELLNHFNKENERTPNSNKVQQNVSISQPADRPLNIYAPIFQPEVRQSQENQNINQFTQMDGHLFSSLCPNNLDVREKYRTEDDMELSQPNQHDYDKGSILKEQSTMIK